MSEEQKAHEDEVFGQELSAEEFEAVAGGNDRSCTDMVMIYDDEADKNNCIHADKRQIYGGGGFPNCAATVESGSWCSDNDACYSGPIGYQGMTSCSKAWR